MSLICVVDDDAAIIESIGSILRRNGYDVEGFTNPQEFLEKLDLLSPSVAILDIFFSEGMQTGDELVRIIGERLLNTQCIVISGESNVERTLASLRNGALDFIEKPVSLPRLLTAVKNALHIHTIRKTGLQRYHMLGRSAAMRNLYARIAKLAPLKECVLICGENGTGKELAAGNIHQRSQRYALPMQSVNCTSLNPNLIESELFGHVAGSFTGAEREKIGYFQSAAGSTLFIDEIGDFDAGLQSKLLRVIQEKQITPVGSTHAMDVDVRLIFATHRILEQQITNGTFREDLYYRISTVTLVVPPLRDRLEDIDDLAPAFLGSFLAENNLPVKELTKEALDKLKEYHYPGNIRELSKIIKNAAIFCSGPHIGADNIDFESPLGREDIWHATRSMTMVQGKDYLEREFIRRRLLSCGNNISRTAESLGIIKNNL